MKLCVLISNLADTFEPIDKFLVIKNNRAKVAYWKTKGYRATTITGVGYAVELQRYTSKNQKGMLKFETLIAPDHHELYNYSIPEKIMEYESNCLSLFVICHDRYYHNGELHLHYHDKGKKIQIAQGDFEDLAGSIEVSNKVIRMIPRVSHTCDIISFMFDYTQHVRYKRVSYTLPRNNGLVRFKILEEDERPLGEHCYLSDTAKLLVHEAADLQAQIQQRYANRIDANRNV